MATITAQLPDGSFVEGDEKNLAALQAAAPGAKVLSPDEYAAAYHTAEIRREESGTRGALISGASGLVEGATGLPLVETGLVGLAKVFGGEGAVAEQQERNRIRGEEQLAANVAGQALGFGGVALASGGTSIAARAVLKAAILPRAIIAGGERAAAFAAARVAEEGVKRTLTAAAARGAAEGLSMTLGSVGKATIGEGHDLTWELVGSHVAAGLFLGGAGGATFAGLGELGGAAARRVGTGTVGAVIGGTLGGLTAGPVGAVAGAATGGIIGRKLGLAAEHGAMALDAAARAAVPKTGAPAKVGDLSADEVADTLRRKAGVDANDVAAAAEKLGDEGVPLGAKEAAASALDLEQQRTARAEGDAAFADSVLQDDFVKKALEKLENPDPAIAAAQRSAGLDADRDLKVAADELGHYQTGTLAQVAKGVEAAHDAATGEAKQRTMQRLAATTDGAPELAAQAKVRIAEEIRAVAGEVEQRAAGLGKMSSQPLFDRQFASLEKSAASLDALPDTAEGLAMAHRIGDEAKRNFDKMTASLSGKGAAVQLPEVQFLQNLQKQSPANGLRLALEDAKIFGDKIAATQFSINEAWRDVIPSLQSFSRNFMRDGLEYSEQNPFAMAKIINDRKLYLFLHGELALPGNNSSIDALSRYIDRQQQFQQTVLRLFGEGAKPNELTRLTSGADAARIAKTQFMTARTAAAAKQAASEMGQDAVERLKISAFGQLPVIGKAIAMMANMQARATVERATAVLLGDANKTIEKAVAAFVRGAQKPGQFVAETATRTARVTAEVAANRKPVDAVSTVPKGATIARQAATAAEQMVIVGSVAGTPKAIEEYAYKGIRPLHYEGNERMTMTAANASARAIAFLSTRRVPIQDGNTTQPQLVRQQLTGPQVATWNTYVATATNPLSVLEDIEKNTVLREQAETLRALYPAVYMAIQTKMLDALHDAKSPISFQQRITLYTFFGTATDPTLTPSFVAAIQAGLKPAAAPSKQQASGGDFSKGVSPERFGTGKSQ